MGVGNGPFSQPFDDLQPKTSLCNEAACQGPERPARYPLAHLIHRTEAQVAFKHPARFPDALFYRNFGTYLLGAGG